MSIIDMTTVPETELPWSNSTSLRKLGVSADEVLEAREVRTNPGTFVPSYLETPDGDPILGLVHQTDYKSEEEYGIGELRRALTGPQSRRFCMTDDAIDYVCIFTDANAIALSTRRIPGSVAWGEPLPGIPEGYADRWDREVTFSRDSYDVANQWMKMEELRKIARDLGVTPLPRKKADLINAIAMSPGLTAKLPDRWPAMFSYGSTLILRAEGDSLAARLIRKLADAAMSGTLAIGSSSGAFHTGMFFYDARDETDQLIADREARFDWHDAQVAKLEPVKAELKERGHNWYALGRPREITRDGVTEVRYWLNSHSYPGIGQPCGWYSLQELLDEKFLSDQKAQKAKDDEERAAKNKR